MTYPAEIQRLVQKYGWVGSVDAAASNRAVQIAVLAKLADDPDANEVIQAAVDDELSKAMQQDPIGASFRYLIRWLQTGTQP